MPQFDDDGPDYDDVTDEDDAPDASTDEGLIAAIREIFQQKLHLDLPADTDSSTFFRDLYAALHGHPGIELQGYDQGGDEDEDDDGAAVAQPQGGAGQMSHRRRKSRPQRMSAARGRTVAAEALQNLRRPSGERSAMGAIKMQQKRAAARLGHNVPQSTKEERLRQQILREALTADGDMLR